MIPALQFIKKSVLDYFRDTSMYAATAKSPSRPTLRNSQRR